MRTKFTRGATLVPATRVTYAVQFVLNWAHLRRDFWPSHGPQEWFGRLPLALRLYRLGAQPPSVGCRLWLYTRWGAMHLDLYLDRRPLR